MFRRLYVSCDYREREYAEVRHLCHFLEAHKCLIDWAPNPWPGSAELETRIEHCDAFVAVAAEGYNASSWLNHELSHAFTLQRYRKHPRPRLFGLSIRGMRLPRCSQHITVEWLDNEESYPLLLYDLPPRA
jgi:hypothetical protein